MHVNRERLISIIDIGVSLKHGRGFIITVQYLYEKITIRIGENKTHSSRRKVDTKYQTRGFTHEDRYVNSETAFNRAISR